ncbi:hypothetical protein WT31_08820 [Burkholderia territorii]|nr:hypothetical protein WT31_08820 [Burkholderia territorii]
MDRKRYVEVFKTRIEKALMHVCIQGLGPALNGLVLCHYMATDCDEHALQPAPEMTLGVRVVVKADGPELLRIDIPEMETRGRAHTSQCVFSFFIARIGRRDDLDKRDRIAHESLLKMVHPHLH